MIYFFRCWHISPEERPSMDEVVEIMTTLSQFFDGHLEPVEYSLSMCSTYRYIRNKTYDVHIRSRKNLLMN